jgi:hypothetical protein
VAVVAHGADPGGLALVELSIDGSPAAEAGSPGNPEAALVTWQHVWEPAGPGTYALSFRAQNHDGEWSAPAEAEVTILSREAPPPTAAPTRTPPPTRTLSPGQACTLRAQFVADASVPDGTMFAPGAAFTKTWTLRNNGDCPWGRGFSLVFAGGAQMGGESPHPLGLAVEPGAMADLSIDLVAPTAPGRYRGEWLLQDPQGRRFGIGADGRVAFWVEVVVGASPTTAPDSQPPAVSASHSPPGESIPVGTLTTLNATANDNVGVARIEIWISLPRGGPQLVQTCNNATACSYPSTFTAGTITYFARAYDAAGNMGATGQTSITFYYVIQ